jgi:hypothetical protein
VKIFELYLDPHGSGRELSTFDKLDVWCYDDFELSDSG